MPRRPLALVSLAALALLAGACGGGGDAGGNRYEDDGAPFTFRYPGDLSEVALSAKEIRGREPVWRTAIGVDAENAVTVATYKLAQPIEQYDQATFLRTLDRTVRALARPQKLSPGERKDAKLGALAGWSYELKDQDVVVQRLTFAFRGQQQLFVRCAWEDDPELQKQVTAACDQVASSVALR